MKKKAIYIAIIVILFTIVSSLFSGVVSYNVMFNTTSRPDYSLTPGLVNYDELSNKIHREKYSFYSDDNLLQGYYYHKENSKALIVMSHGIKDGADSLLSEILYFYQNDFSIFSYDNSGCFDSKGKEKGFTQSLIDLKNTLEFLNTNNNFKNYKKCLFGVSVGGFAATSIFNIDNYNVFASASISGFNDSKEIFFENGKKYVGPLMYLGKPLANVYINNKFKEFANYTAVDGINKVNIPFFIANSKNDSVVSYLSSIAYQKDNITNPNVTYYIVNDYDHFSILHSNDAINYQSKVNNELKNINSKQKKKDYIKTVDDNLYSQLNEDLFSKIILFYNNSI